MCNLNKEESLFHIIGLRIDFVSGIHREDDFWETLLRPNNVEQECPNLAYTGHIRSLGLRIKYYNSIDICYSKKMVNNVEIRTLLFF